MTQTLTFHLVTPEAQVLSEDVHMVVVPGEMGEFGVLPHHAPLIAALRPGFVTSYVNGGKTQQIFVRDGFAHVSDGACTILAEESIFVKDMDAALLAADLKRAEDELSMVRKEEERTSLQSHMEKLRTKIDLLKMLN